MIIIGQISQTNLTSRKQEQFFFIICYLVCSTRDLPVGIPRDIYSICFYIRFVCMLICTIVSCPFKTCPGTAEWFTFVHLAIVAVACGRCCRLGWTLLWCLSDPAWFGGVWVFWTPRVWTWWIGCSLSGGEELFVLALRGRCLLVRTPLSFYGVRSGSSRGLSRIV
jgi:hypothetical protein